MQTKNVLLEDNFLKFKGVLKMKKVLLLIMVFALVFSVVFVASAAEDYVSFSGGGQIFDTNGEETYKISFGGKVYGYGTDPNELFLEGMTVRFHNISVDEFDKTTFKATEVWKIDDWYQARIWLYGELDGKPGYRMQIYALDDTIKFRLFVGGEFGDGNAADYDSYASGDFSPDLDSRTLVDRGKIKVYLP